MRRPWLVLGVLLLGAATACGSNSSVSGTGPPNSVAAPAQPDGSSPSESARMICAKEARAEVAGVLANRPTSVSRPTWSNHLYTCDYVYPQGTVTLSVRELDDEAGTTAYLDTLAILLGRLPDDVHLGQGAFETPNGSIVVRKDFKVLLVDVSHLPHGFDRPRLAAADVASTIAVTVLHCWRG